ncbi:MAG: response regulator transcription factor [Gammaproteobacteria bacterium]|nr:response regulator transcription factor [Gammaproteobacteria bacterium]
MADVNKIKALIVDDEMHIRELMKAVLSSMNVDISGEASNGEEAVKLYQETHPNVVLLDINMPVIDGVTALKEIKKIDPQSFVIMLTSITNMDTIQTCIDAGAGGYIRKDTPIDEIRKNIKSAWENR